MQGVIAGLEVAVGLNLQDVHIVSDNVEAVWSITSGIGMDSQVLKEKFEAVLPMLDNPGCIIRHNFRELNHLADALAKEARRRCWNWTRLDAIPFEVARIRHLDQLDSY